jgi:hypothetical protein
VPSRLNLNRETVYLEKSIAETFALKAFKNVIVRNVNGALFGLDLIELTFRDLYLGRSEMWRLKYALVGSGVFLNKKVDLCKDAVRLTVNQMWKDGQNYGSGVVTPDTKVVFRSPTAMIYLFIQMSAEMWEFDPNGDLYFDKAVSFLKEMFLRWKTDGSSHEVTIVLFSRCFYDADNTDAFPKVMQQCVQKRKEGFYEDFYRVVVQNERFDDWQETILELRKIFTNYKEFVVEYHKSNLSDCGRCEEQSEVGSDLPKATICSAGKGNFLEVLNMSLNTFENSYLNRNLDRTGMQSIVITPGKKCFVSESRICSLYHSLQFRCGRVRRRPRVKPNHEAAHHRQRRRQRPHLPRGATSTRVTAANIRKRGRYRAQEVRRRRRIKFQSDGSKQIYPLYSSMPHWINLSYYASNSRKAGNNKFKPRLTPPVGLEIQRHRTFLKTDHMPRLETFTDDGDDDHLFDDSDALTFQPVRPNHQNPKPLVGTKSCGSGDKALANILATVEAAANPTTKGVDAADSPPNRRASSGGSVRNLGARPKSNHDTFRRTSVPSADANNGGGGAGRSSIAAEEDDFQSISRSGVFRQQNPANGALREQDEHNITDGTAGGDAQGQPSAEGSYSTGDFDHHRIKRTLLGPGRALDNPFNPNYTSERMTENRRRWTHVFSQGTVSRQQPQHLAVGGATGGPPGAVGGCGGGVNSVYSTVTSVSGLIGNQSNSVSSVDKTIWDEKDFSEKQKNQTGVDWKSLTIPASFPITTDFFPSNALTFRKDYYVTEYSLAPEEILGEVVMRRKMLSNTEIFHELVSQRLAQGFQLIVLSERSASYEQMNRYALNSCNPVSQKPDHVFWLSIGTLYHRIMLSDDHSQILVMKFQPKKPPGSQELLDRKVHYRYRFQAPDNDKYEVSWIDFHVEKLENYNWNHMDFYTLSRGDKDYSLMDNLKYWRIRLYLIPNSVYVKQTKSIVDGSSGDMCDVYDETAIRASDFDPCEGLFRFIEVCLNRLRKAPRPATDKNCIICTLALTTGDEDVEQVVAAMRVSGCSCGLQFATNQSLPSMTFVSYDAATWIQKRLSDVPDSAAAVTYLDKLLKRNLIRHSSGCVTSLFLYGFCLYSFTDSDNLSSHGDFEDFTNEWVEVRLDTPTSQHYKMAYTDVDLYGKSDRYEWAHLRYRSQFVPFSAYEINLQWTVSTGALVTELVSSWARRAQSSYCTIPAPYDPFALPIARNSDPVRGPIFIELDASFLALHEDRIKASNGGNSGEEVFLTLEFREAIAKKYGFIACPTDPANKRLSEHFSTDHQYLHCTGNMFLLIPTKVDKASGIQGITKPQRFHSTTSNVSAVARSPPTTTAEEQEQQVPQEDVAGTTTTTRHLSETRPDYDHSRTGFLWSWNFTISRRWKSLCSTGATGDIRFMDKILLDFRKFCANDGGRMEKFWLEFHGVRTEASP